MTGIRQPHHFHPIHEKDVENKEDVKPWRLPFWTEPPAWLIEKEKKEHAEQQQANEEETPEQVDLPTAEELENIRREAYNAGLEQGLVEGRQQGHKEGYDAGHKESYDAGFTAGKRDGQKQGQEEGKALGLRQGQADINNTVQRLTRVMRQLQSTLNERDEALPEVLAAMVAGMCEQVLQTELHNGARNIYRYVRHALDELPAGEKHIQVFIGADDAIHLQNSLDISGDDIHYSVDDKLAAGECRVESEHSLVEYSTGEHLNQLLERVLPMLMHQAATFPDEAEQNQIHQQDTPAADDYVSEVAAGVESQTTEQSSAEPVVDDAAATEVLSRADNIESESQPADSAAEDDKKATDQDPRHEPE
ncbi:MAG: hypothetical protein CMI02_02575 [Oceanospirillaceae bacterium]|nr:hypothetical protein [Oceanospirillaceae bacterium]MBT10904.1 hypothetical protein [Oceanospirillaceae bacterium]|tara:strand:- start:56598 stop:57686 length:1089 start_codon:yes stop_codon:yes gene_type:complete